MRFFYAIMLYASSLMLLFFIALIIVPTPVVSVIDDKYFNIKASQKNVIDENIEEIFRIIKTEKPDISIEFYGFDKSIDEKRSLAFTLYAAGAVISIIIILIISLLRSYIIFPSVAAVLTVMLVFIVIWTFTSVLPMKLYIDLQHLHETYKGLNALQFLIPFIAVQAVMIGFGYWFKYKE